MSMGSAYVYTTPSKSSEWNVGAKALNDTSSMVGQTIDILYKTSFSNENKLGYVLYNDQFEGESGSSTKAHAKGVIIFDETSAIWIAHSIPEFPPKPNTKTYKIDSDQLIYGQSMICLSLSFEALSQVGLQLYYAYPQVYDYHIPSSMADKAALKNLKEVVEKKHVTKEPFTSVQAIKTRENVEFLTFYKYSKFNQDLYGDLVGKELKTALYTETWRRGSAANMPSVCDEPNKVNNILSINIASIGVGFSSMSDHSKWAVSDPADETSALKFLCIGDINRQESQAKRGGGTICFKNNPGVWKLYKGIVSDVEPCPKKN